MAVRMRKTTDVPKKTKTEIAREAKRSVEIIDESYKDMSLPKLREAYAKVLREKQKLERGGYCHKCGQFMPLDKFYVDEANASGRTCYCKACVFKVATQYNEKTREAHETEDSIKQALKLINRPFLRTVYDAACQAVNNGASQRAKVYVFQQIMTLLSSLPQYTSLTWKDSDPEIIDEDEGRSLELKKASKRMREFWGDEFSDKDLVFLDKEYQDWVTRHECQTKSQEEVFKRICFKQLEIYKATLAGENTKDLDKTFQDLLDTGNLKPKNNALDTLSNAQTLGTLIDKWENTRPVPDIDPELQDVDRIGMLITVFFTGHLAKILKIKNTFANIYDNFMAKFTVNKPEYADEDNDEELFNRIFGSASDE